jgi:hypothetical protein
MFSRFFPSRVLFPLAKLTPHRLPVHQTTVRENPTKEEAYAS